MYPSRASLPSTLECSCLCSELLPVKQNCPQTTVTWPASSGLWRETTLVFLSHTWDIQDSGFCIQNVFTRSWVIFRVSPFFRCRIKLLFCPTLYCKFWFCLNISETTPCHVPTHLPCFWDKYALQVPCRWFWAVVLPDALGGPEIGTTSCHGATYRVGDVFCPLAEWGLK